MDEFVAAIRYQRKYAIRVLRHGRKAAGLGKRGRCREYQGKVVTELTRIWEICSRICLKRLKGQFLHTFTTTDVTTGRTKCMVVLHRSPQRVFVVLQTIRQRLPYPLLGLDSGGLCKPFSVGLVRRPKWIFKEP